MFRFDRLAENETMGGGSKATASGKDLIVGFDGRRAVKKFFPVLKFTTVSVAQVIGRSGLLCDF